MAGEYGIGRKNPFALAEEDQRNVRLISTVCLHDRGRIDVEKQSRKARGLRCRPMGMSLTVSSQDDVTDRET